MIHKIGRIKDLDTVSTIEPSVRSVLSDYVKVFDCMYGKNRDVDKDLGGYVLYAESGSTPEDVKTVFDYTDSIPEYMDHVPISQGTVYIACYILSSDYAVVLVGYDKDCPPELLKQI